MTKPNRLPVFLACLTLLSASVWAQDKERIANEGSIGDKWMLSDGETLATAQYPGYMAPRGDNVCIALGYLINKDGSTSEFSVLKQWNSESGEKEPVDGFWQAFAVAGADAVSQWKFKPRPGVDNPVPTRTVAILGFNAGQGVDAAELRNHCHIADLRAHLADLGRQGKSDGINRHELDAHFRQQIHNEIKANIRRSSGP